MEECGKEQDEDTMPVDFFCQVVTLMTMMAMMIMIRIVMITTRTPCLSTSSAR